MPEANRPNPPKKTKLGPQQNSSPRRRVELANSGPPSPWLMRPSDSEVKSFKGSFVEYLRWMRSPGGEYKDATKLQIMQLAQEQADYFDRLEKLTKRTHKIVKA